MRGLNFTWNTAHEEGFGRGDSVAVGQKCARECACAGADAAAAAAPALT